jgi:hypothetical protein
MAQDYTASMEPVLRPLLASGERLLAASPLVKDQGTTADVSVKDELKNLLDPTILIGLGSHPGNLIQRAVFGRAVVGAPGSTARLTFEAVASVTAPKVVVTDSRLVVVDVDLVPRGRGLLRSWFGPMDEIARVVHEVPRAAILGAVGAPAGLLRRGRILVRFSDGSVCALVCATPRLRDQVIEAIGPVTPATST